MRYQGKIKKWKDDKGFGFIAPNGGGSDVFLHISEFSNRHKRPAIGDLVTYEVVAGDAGGQKAINVLFVAHRRTAGSNNRNGFNATSLIFIALVLSAVAYVFYIRLSHPNSTIQASVYKATFGRSALHNQSQFQCTGNTHCSQMTSCSEAFFYQEHCPATEMDGDRDGIPCEQQWCK